MRSNAFFAMTFDRIRLEHWGWSSCVFLTEMHRQICNMTYLGHNVTSLDLDRRSNFGIFFLGKHAYISTRLDKRSTMASELFRQLS